MSVTRPGASASGSTGWWRPTQGLARALVGVLVVQAVTQVVLATQGTPRALDDTARQLDAVLHDQRTTVDYRSSDGALSLFSVVAIALLVLVILWQWRSVSNARALGRDGARISPGWVIAGWLVPGANLVVPYLSLQDLWRNTDPHSEPGSGWRRLPGSPLVTAFWITYVVGVVTPLAVTAAVLATATSAADTDWITNAGYGIGALGSVLGIFVVLDITARQNRQQDAAPAPTTPPVWGSTTRTESAWDASSGGGGWHPDPLGRFEYRYWDGSIWTDWVSRDGQMQIDPEKVPGYD